MAQLTLSFFDNTRGTPISGIDIELQKVHEGKWRVLSQLSTGIDGKVSISESEANDDLSGYYEATARIGSYFLDAGYVLPTLKFIDVVPIRFGIPEAGTDTTLTISVTPFGYSLQAS
ncbi:MAG: hydroxyisourate hydrolase [Rhodobacteraceae bacterium]|nr:hydroxyisourate hydrolase [Paracoccaceae bacterium]